MRAQVGRTPVQQLAPETPSRVGRTPRRRPAKPLHGDPRRPELPGRAPAPPNPRPRPAPRSPEKLSKAVGMYSVG